ncbi:DUF4760 domain-containing protein [Vibrio splendidus]|uniref:DUF4760 domain-containing protein n=1 Tax=Vibrio splendidus TaxID=29497 RepID=UPI0034A0BED7
MRKETSLINVLILLSMVLIAFFVGVHIGGVLIGNLSIKDFMTPSVALMSALIAAFMVTRTINNNKRSELLKNTLDAIDNELFKGEKKVKLDSACNLLTQRMDSEGSFKALVRLRKNATRFVSEFKNANPEEYAHIIDALDYANKLCFGVKSGIYDKDLINKFLGQSVFNVWWAGMVLIRERELEYLDEMASNNRRVPDFGSPYESLFTWIRAVADKQKLDNVQFVLVRLDTGYYNRESFKELEVEMAEKL